jgi:Cytotoxic
LVQDRSSPAAKICARRVLLTIRQQFPRIIRAMETHRTELQRRDGQQRDFPCCPAPNSLPAFPNAVRVMPRGGRIRWRDQDGSLLEWESRDGALEMYGARGWHLGEYDHVHGDTLKLAEPGRRIEP